MPARSHRQQSSDRPVAVWEGSQFVYHSLAHVNRELTLALIKNSQAADLAVVPFDAQQFDPRTDPRFAAIQERIGRAMPNPPVVHVRHYWPPNFTPPPSGAWVMVQPWEFGGLPDEWVAPMRDQVDEVWAYTTWLRECYIASGIPAEKVKVIPLGVRTDLYQPDGTRYPLATRKRFKFLFVGGTTGRKGIVNLLQTYRASFTAADDVCLVIKAIGTESFYAGQHVHDFLAEAAQDPNAPEIEYLDSQLTDPQMAGLYRACDALVHPYRGEGFGLPIVEAMASQLPVIVTGYGACLDYCTDENAYLIPAQPVPIPDIRFLPPSTTGYWWAEPDLHALATLMQRVVADPEAARNVGRRARQSMLAQTWTRSAQLVDERLRELATRTPLRVDPFQPIAAPLPLDGRRGRVFFHHPRWDGTAWREVVLAYVTAFGSDDDVMLVLWLDPAQAVAPADVQQRLEETFATAGIDAERTPDLLLVPDDLDLVGLGRLYAAVDWVVPNGDSVQATRAEHSGAGVLTRLDPESWRSATWTRGSAPA